MLKDQGNEAFRRKDWETARKYYTSAIEHDKQNELLYMNLAAVQLNLGAYEEAKLRANTALRITSGKNAKAWYRRGAAFTSLGDPINGYYDYLSAQLVAPSDNTIKTAMAETKDIMIKLCQQAEKDQISQSPDVWMAQLFDYKDEFISLMSSSINTLCLHEKPSPTVAAWLNLLRHHNKKLESLTISNTKMTPAMSTALNTYLSSITSLKHLSLASTELGPHFLSQLVGPLKANKQLTCLDLSGCHLRHFGILPLKSILWSSDTGVKTLNLKNNGIGDRGMVELNVALEYRITVDTLYLDNNNLTDASAGSICSLIIYHPVIECMSLANNPFTQNGLHQITTTFFDCPQVKKLNLSGIPISPEFMADLTKLQQQKNREILFTEISSSPKNQLYL